MDEDRASRLVRLRTAYPTFVYDGFAWHEDAPGSVTCSFRFRTGELGYQPTSRLTFEGAHERSRIAPEVMDNLVFHLGLAELPSYWKATCSPHVEVRAGALSDDQIAFWRSILTDGMGEFHFANQTQFTDPGFVTIASSPSSGERAHAVFEERLADGPLVPVGGGKDSLVTLDLLGQRSDDVAAMAINPPPSTTAALAVAGVATRVVVDRRIDPRLLERNAAGFLNGHTPFGAVIAFTAALAAVLLGRKHVALSNESSSDHATVLYRGRVINHQYGKSRALEAAMHRYLRAHVARDLHYFSLLRPFNELQIAGQFSALSAFHPVVRSCNRGRKTDTWCGRCPKCVSTFVVLAPFLDRPALCGIFGKDLLLDPDCQALLPALLGEEGTTRPFECVATPAELRAALALARGERVSSAILNVLTQRSEPHLVPPDLYAAADAALRPRVQPLLGRAAVGVLGFGREGTSTARHLVSGNETLDLTVLDDDPTVAARLPPAGHPSQRVQFAPASDGRASPAIDILFKSPGVPPDHPAIRAVKGRPHLLTSNTELFFETRVGTLIGVTGTKGKSTTTSLIAHVLSAAGKDARLVGNIGTPCLEGLEGADARTIHCVELSSFQLETLRAAPDIAVVLGIFGDHLDRYGDMAAYVEAKSAITRYQTRRDVVMYKADCPRASELASLSVGRRMPFTRTRPPLLGDAPGPLLGAFNDDNLWPAILVGRLFGIDDDALAASIRTFRPLPGRLEEVVRKDGVRFVCDIRSTAPEVTVAALEALAGAGDDVAFLFLGGVDRQQDYRTLVPALERSSVRHIVLFPPTGARIRALLAGTPLGERFAFFEARSMEEAIRYVYDHAPATGSVCLMSTGAPSNGGLFSGPEDKARQFAHWATHLGRETHAG